MVYIAFQILHYAIVIQIKTGWELLTLSFLETFLEISQLAPFITVDNQQIAVVLQTKTNLRQWNFGEDSLGFFD